MSSATSAPVESRGARGWRPLLDGEAAAEARAAIEAIAATLSRSFPAMDGVSGTALARQVALDSGRPGVALFYAYLARSTDDRAAADEAESLLTSALDAVPSTGLGASLYGGIAGVDWTAAHLQRLGLISSDRATSFGQWTDAGLATALNPATETGLLDHFDLISGLVGVGIATLERLPSPSARALLERIVLRLSDRAERREDGITWWTAPQHTGRADRVPHGWYNLGLAHGVPGVIGFLGHACAAGIAPTVARALLDGAVGWLLAQRRQFTSGGCFPTVLAEGIEPTPGRLSWCYGDAGIAAALLVAARSVDEPAWERVALDLALSAAERPAEAAGVVDATLCHGAIGLGHIFNRLAQQVGEPRLADAARVWLARGLAMRRAGGKLGGFYARLPDEAGQPPRLVAFRGFLEGAAGIGLALLAATTDVDPAWDRLLLLT